MENVAKPKFTMEEIRARSAPLARKYGVKKLALFGSYAGNRAGRTSDIDFLIEKGKITGLLSEEIKQRYGAIPWSKIKAMRNIAVHNYESFDMTLLWETANHDISHLKNPTAKKYSAILCQGTK